MKKGIKRTLKVLSLIIAVVLTSAFLQEYILCDFDHNRERIKGFYLEKDNSLDVMFLGASEAYCDFAPGYAYQKYGFTSYLYASQSTSILSCKYKLKEVLKTQKPKLIVIELNSAVYGSDARVRMEANIRHFVDNAPLSWDKYEFAHVYDPDNEWEYVFPLIKYHDAWKNIPEDTELLGTIVNDKFRGSNYLKGMRNETRVYKSKQKPLNEVMINDNKNVPLTRLSEKTLRELLQFCKDNKLDNVVFARFPHVVTKKTVTRFYRSNAVADIVREYGYDFINYEKNYTETGIDFSKDFYNIDHLNVYGQRKFTDFFSKVIMDRYGIKKSNLSPELKKEWDTASDYYNAYYQYSDEVIKSGRITDLDEGAVEDAGFKKYLKNKQ